MTEHLMFIEWIIHNPFPCADVVKEQFWLFKKKIIGVVTWGVMEFFNTYYIGVVIFPHSKKRRWIFPVLSMVLFHIADVFSTICYRILSAVIGYRSAEKKLE